MKKLFEYPEIEIEVMNIVDIIASSFDGDLDEDQTPWN